MTFSNIDAHMGGGGRGGTSWTPYKDFWKLPHKNAIKTTPPLIFSQPQVPPSKEFFKKPKDPPPDFQLLCIYVFKLENKTRKRVADCQSNIVFKDAQSFSIYFEGVVKKSRGSNIFVFHCIFMSKFSKSFEGKVYMRCPPPPLCASMIVFNPKSLQRKFWSELWTFRICRRPVFVTLRGGKCPNRNWKIYILPYLTFRACKRPVVVKPKLTYPLIT
jgi:hypothetical protein